MVHVILRYFNALWWLFCKVIEALKLGTATLKGVNVQLGVESVEDAMDELNEVSIKINLFIFSQASECAIILNP